MRKRILVIISLLFSVVLNGCANKEKEKSAHYDYSIIVCKHLFIYILYFSFVTEK
jgi:hypothetical protein